MASSDIIRNMQQELTYAANIERQEEAQKLLDYYNGIQLEHLDDVMSTQFSDPDSLKMQLAVDNITRFIGDEISRVFDSPPVLTCENEAGQRLIDEQMKTGVLPLMFKTAEVYANLTGVCALHPWYDPIANIIKNAILPSSVLFVAQRRDDPTEAEAVVYTRETRDTISAAPRVEYVHWDSEQVFVFDSASYGVPRPPSPDNPEMINPYGVLPFAWFRDQVAVGTFFTELDETLINAQETLNVMLTSLNQLTKYQGFSQPVLRGCDAGKSIVVDPSRPIRIPPAMRDEQPGKFEFVTPASKIMEILEEVKALIERTCSRFGIASTTLRGDTSALSGYAMKLQDARLERRRIDSKPLCRAALLQWWEIVKVINNTHNGAAGQVPADAELVIDFAEPEYMDNPADVLKLQQQEIELGLISPVQILMSRNPDLDEAAAKALYDKNLSDRQATKKKFGLADILGGPVAE